MDFSWTPEQNALRTEAARVAADAVSRFGRFNDSWINGYSKEFSKELGAHGWIGMTWPDNPYSGTARPGLDRLIVGEEMIKAGAPIAASWFADRQMGPALLGVGVAQLVFGRLAFRNIARHIQNVWNPIQVNHCCRHQAVQGMAIFRPKHGFKVGHHAVLAQSFDQSFPVLGVVPNIDIQ